MKIFLSNFATFRQPYECLQAEIDLCNKLRMSPTSEISESARQGCP